MGFIDKLLRREQTLARTTEALAAELRRLGCRVDAVDLEAGELKAKAGGADMVVNAHNLFHALTQSPRRTRREQIERFARGVSNPGDDGLLATFEDAAASLMPVVRYGDDFGIFELSRLLAAGSDEPPRVACMRPLVGGAVVALVLDSADAMRHVYADQLDTWGVSFDDALERALSNLRGLPEHGGWKEIAPGVWSGEWGDAYESSRILVPDLIHRLGVPRPVAMVPYRGAVLVTSAASDAGVEAMLATVERTLGTGRWVSMTPMELVDRSWREFTPPPSLRERFRALRYQEISQCHDSQRELLEKLNQKRGDDVFIAAYTVYKVADTCVSLATWTEDVDTLIPQADAIAFARPDEGDEWEVVVVPWNEAVTLVGALLQATPWSPMRYRVRTYPDAETWERLRAANRTFEQLAAQRQG